MIRLGRPERLAEKTYEPARRSAKAQLARNSFSPPYPDDPPLAPFSPAPRSTLEVILAIKARPQRRVSFDSHCE
jgi:hypothetical protein